MVTTYTKIPKASGTAYTGIVNVNGASKYGFAIYGLSTYGATTNYINVAKPAGDSVITSGTATGLLMPPTYSSDIVVGGIWTKINKAT